MNEFTENECLPNFELKLFFFKKIGGNHSHSNVRENALILKGFPLFAHLRGSQNR